MCHFFHKVWDTPQISLLRLQGVSWVNRWGRAPPDPSVFRFTECGSTFLQLGKPGYCQTRINRRLHVGLGKLPSCFSAQEVWSTGLVLLTLSAIGCLPSLPCRPCVKPANSAPGGEASLPIGSRKNVSEAERNVLLFSRPFCRAIQMAGRTD